MLLLFPLLVLFGIVRPSVGLVRGPLVCVCVYPCLSFVVVAWLIVRVGEGGGWNGGWVLNLSLGGGFEFLNFFESAALRRP